MKDYECAAPTGVSAYSLHLYCSLRAIADACRQIAASEASLAIMGEGWVTAHRKLGAYADWAIAECNGPKEKRP